MRDPSIPAPEVRAIGRACVRQTPLGAQKWFIWYPPRLTPLEIGFVHRSRLPRVWASEPQRLVPRFR